MKQQIIFLIALAMIVTLNSCKKDKDETPTPVTWPDYSQLKTGNYWIYREYTIDSLGNATETSTYDSCFIEKDTLINNKTYYKLNKAMSHWPEYYQYQCLRDSLHYIVDASGKILFSSQDFSTTFSSSYQVATGNDTICHITQKMADKDQQTIVSAGTFKTSDFKTSYQMYPAYAVNGTQRYRHARYAENTGLVVETLPFFLGQSFYTERRLVRYHLN